MATLEELITKLYDGVVNYDEDAICGGAQEVVDAGLDAYKAVMHGLAGGMKKVGELYEDNVYFVPEVLMCADALYKGLDILRPHVILPEEAARMKAIVVIGVVQGDVHDIGKNLVKMMFDVAGFEVYDLGRDVPLEHFAKEQLKTDADLVCLSAMMTTSMLGMPKVIKMIKEKAPNCKIMIGGAPITDEIVEQYGADGTAENASSALKEAIDMVASLKDMDLSKM
jgi:methylmalonyl-CoA mutase cobalamin-binding domain/chain